MAARKQNISKDTTAAKKQKCTKDTVIVGKQKILKGHDIDGKTKNAQRVHRRAKNDQHTRRCQW